MMELAVFFWVSIAFFAGIGFMRGWAKELIATAGIVLALFAIKQFETLFIDPLTDGRQLAKFNLEALILVAMAFFAYQTPPDRISRSKRAIVREGFQEGILGALAGGINGYLLVGSLWWYMDNTQYPLSPHVMPVNPASASAELVNILPLSWMLSGDGSLLSLLMIGLFVFVIIAII